MLSALPLVIAHRGSSTEFPENTLAAFDAALAEGADGIELDVRLSKDEQAVVFHDADLSKVGRESAHVSDLTWQELQQLDVGGWRGRRVCHLRMVRLNTVLNRYGGRTTLLLELKVDDKAKATGQHRLLVERVLRLIQPLDKDSLFLLCFDLETLQHAHGLAPETRCVLNVNGQLDLLPQCEFLSAWSHEIGTLSHAFADRLRDLGKPLMTWVCNTPADVAKATRLGAEYIMTDRPHWLAERLQDPHE